jgi:hypothetical protein
LDVSTHDVIFLKVGDELVEMAAAPYDSEAILQDLLARYPDLLAGSEMGMERPRRWLLVKREMGVPDDLDAADRWSIDHLFLDQDAVPTLVEVKRSTDTRIRREVVGQMLDYAANASLFWAVDVLRQEIQQRCDREDPSSTIADLLISELGIGDPDVDEFFAQVKTNLSAGRIRMVFVADIIPVELRRIVEFLNGQLRLAQVFAVEVRQYVGGGHQTLVPRLIGATAAADDAKGRTGPMPSIDEIFAVASPATARLRSHLTEWAASVGATVVATRTGMKVIHPKGHSMVILYGGSGLEFQVERVMKSGQEEVAREILDALAGIHPTGHLAPKFPKLPADLADASWDEVEAKPLALLLAAFGAAG